MNPLKNLSMNFWKFVFQEFMKNSALDESLEDYLEKFLKKLTHTVHAKFSLVIPCVIPGGILEEVSIAFSEKNPNKSWRSLNHFPKNLWKNF